MKMTTRVHVCFTQPWPHLHYGRSTVILVGIKRPLRKYSHGKDQRSLDSSKTWAITQPASVLPQSVVLKKKRGKRESKRLKGNQTEKWKTEQTNEQSKAGKWKQNRHGEAIKKRES